jgi:hypothetical protein
VPASEQQCHLAAIEVCDVATVGRSRQRGWKSSTQSIHGEV